MMKRLLLIPLLVGLIPSANAGIYYHPFYQNGVEIRCDDDEPRHAIFFKNGRAMLFEDDGDEKYKFDFGGQVHQLYDLKIKV